MTSGPRPHLVPTVYLHLRPKADSHCPASHSHALGKHFSVPRADQVLGPETMPQALPCTVGQAHTLATYLDLHGHLAAALHAGQVHLPDRSSCEGPLLKVLQLVTPVGAQVIV